MIVMKFGGTSVGNADRIKNAAEIIKSYAEKNLVVVVKIANIRLRVKNQISTI